MVLKAQQGEREMYFYGLEDLASAGGDTYGLIGFFLHYSSQVYQELRASNQMDSGEIERRGKESCSVCRLYGLSGGSVDLVAAQGF